MLRTQRFSLHSLMSLQPLKQSSTHSLFIVTRASFTVLSVMTQIPNTMRTAPNFPSRIKNGFISKISLSVPSSRHISHFSHKMKRNAKLYSLLVLLGLIPVSAYAIYIKFIVPLQEKDAVYPPHVKTHLRKALMGQKNRDDFESVELEYLRALDACQEKDPRLSDLDLKVIGIRERLAEYYGSVEGKKLECLAMYLRACVDLMTLKKGKVNDRGLYLEEDRSSSSGHVDGSLNNIEYQDLHLDNIEKKERIKRCLGNLYHVGFILEEYGYFKEAWILREWTLKQSIGILEPFMDVINNLSAFFEKENCIDIIKRVQNEARAVQVWLSSTDFLPEHEKRSLIQRLYSNSSETNSEANNESETKKLMKSTSHPKATFKPLDFIDLNSFVCFTSALASSYSHFKQNDVALALYFRSLQTLTQSAPKESGKMLNHDMVSKICLRMAEEFVSLRDIEKAKYWAEAAMDHREMNFQQQKQQPTGFSLSIGSTSDPQEDKIEFMYALGTVQEKTKQYKSALSSYKQAYRATPEEDAETRKVLKKSLRRVHNLISKAKNKEKPSSSLTPSEAAEV